jgi:hypothetical protein
MQFSVTDITDIPENIKNLRSLQVADFSSNPIPRYALFGKEVKGGIFVLFCDLLHTEN